MIITDRPLESPTSEYDILDSPRKDAGDKNTDTPRRRHLPTVSGNEEEGTKVKLEWENVSYVISKDKDEINILKSVSGTANPGELLVLMGSSGAGKTTLLNVLSGRLQNTGEAKIYGTITANGTNIKDFNFEYYSAYVTQEDILLPFLTPRESMLFSSKLRLPGTHEQHAERVEKILNDLKLMKVADNIVGNAMKKGLSGGERKRVCIGMELISEPLILILDEPTSGLDSFTAEIVIDLLIEQARKGRTIISTIHQPSSNVFNKFDKLVLLSEGHIVYQGRAKDSRKYFSKIGYKCPRLMNPADYYMRLLHVVDRKHPTQEETETIETLVSSYNSKLENENENPELSEELTPLENRHISKPSGSFKQFWVLLRRSWINSRRNPLYSWILYIEYLGIAILVDILFPNLGTDYESVYSRTIIQFLSMFIVSFYSAQNAALVFPSETPLFLKETKQRLYGVFPYNMAKSIAETPTQLLALIFYCLMIYWTVGCNNTDASKFWIFVLGLVLMQWSSAGIGYIIGSMCKTEHLAIAITPLFLTPLEMYTGVVTNVESYPKSFFWIQYLSPMRFDIEGLCINEYTDLHMDCKTCTNCYRCDPLNDMKFTGEIWLCFIYVVLLGIGYRFIGFLILWKKASKSRA
ncbi:unnamed protein product [Blepharisma stoltei]|uniref:ABC transporter domain-containing protein n=1 Tax=Blepharisma stoltei TaxID=1481888 RepID=A0AAU9JQ78_9CILI|nr:unnamed protein product [Blepharisma stoltei]